VRRRLALIVAALAILAVAGFADRSQRPADSHDGAPASSRISGQPAPDPALPAFLSAPAKGQATVQTLTFSQARRDGRPSEGVTTASQLSRVGADHAARPRAFPLLI
jgi:hypothetical protein